MTKAKTDKQDEFYTRIEEIEEELRYYTKHFKNKIVLCNCDDPFESNFFQYFVLNFNHLGLKKLICTSYAGSPILGAELGDVKVPYKAVITNVPDPIRPEQLKDIFDLDGNELTELQGDGDFQSDECIELLKESDIVVTNPPFSLLRLYIKQLIDYDKKFIIIGNISAVSTKDIFPYFLNGQMWLGASIHSGDRIFYVPDYYPLEAAGCGIDENGRKWVRVKGVRWFSNLDYPQRHEPFRPGKRYKPEKYKKFDDYDALYIKETKDIPEDYDGVMGVPVTFIDKHSPDQYEILGIDRYMADNPHYGKRFSFNGKETFARIMIRKIKDESNSKESND